MKCPLCQERSQTCVKLEVIDNARMRCPLCGAEVIDYTADSAAIRIAEAKLRHYPEHKIRLETLPPGTSKDIIYSEGGRGDGPKSSVQERWVMKNEKELREVAVIEKMLKLLSPEERELVRQAYFQNRNWDHVIRDLHLTKSTFYRQKDRVVRRFARAFGLL